VAFSDAESVATCAGAVVRADRVVDGLEYGRATVGGDDATDTVCDLIERIDRPDVTALLLAGVAPAWFNLLDPERLHEQTGLPTLALSFEASPGLEPAIREQFDGDAREWRLDAYRSLPPRRSLTVNDERLFVRAVGIDENLRFSSASQTQSDDVDESRRLSSANRTLSDDVDAPVADETETGTTEIPPLAPNCEAARIVRAFTPEGGRPEPLRVARLAARAGRELGERLTAERRR
jgi:endonuclease V-like protein UPF0215 family